MMNCAKRKSIFRKRPINLQRKYSQEPEKIVTLNKEIIKGINQRADTEKRGGNADRDVPGKHVGEMH